MKTAETKFGQIQLVQTTKVLLNESQVFFFDIFHSNLELSEIF